jgi:hypothetical protein
MKFIDLLQTASSSMLRSKARTFLTIIAIFIGAKKLRKLTTVSTLYLTKLVSSSQRHSLSNY